MAFNDTLSDHTAFLRVCAADLRHYANAADTLGLGRLAEALDSTAEGLVSSGKNLSAAYTADLSEQLEGARQNVGAVLSALAEAAS